MSILAYLDPFQDLNGEEGVHNNCDGTSSLLPLQVPAKIFRYLGEIMGFQCFPTVMNYICKTYTPAKGPHEK